MATDITHCSIDNCLEPVVTSIITIGGSYQNTNSNIEYLCEKHAYERGHKLFTGSFVFAPLELNVLACALRAWIGILETEEKLPDDCRMAKNLLDRFNEEYRKHLSDLLGHSVAKL